MRTIVVHVLENNKIRLRFKNWLIFGFVQAFLDRFVRVLETFLKKNRVDFALKTEVMT